MRKRLKRIICIVLVLICLCMQGCLLEKMAERAEERRISTAKKYMQEHKQIADSFVSEAPEYTFTIKLGSEFVDNDDALNQGYEHIWPDYIYVNNSGKGFDIIFDVLNNFVRDENGKIIGYEFSLSNRTAEVKKEIIIDTTDEKTHFAFFSFRKAYNFLYDGKIFLVTYTDEAEMYSGNQYNKKSRPPALYLMDFDNSRLIYVGYFVEYFDYVEENDYNFYQTCDFYVKMTTKDGVN